MIPGEKKINISQIFKWYEKDFNGKKSVIEFIEKYLVDDDKKDFLAQNKDSLTIKYLYYDRDLNM
ncbi:hypothetical protein BMS3Abin07_00193 [bacterium BMS3Abin07]|nr:hypothetical protein BMS3Abin07_00193 [bacterium BMS3Abin07]GBE33441.1 hypothetical protein BMS3Bbin05_02382 [bacterium BMS3Bbin05]HDO21959.1 hypothetical protein [Nitrospirota bacterium]HDO22330.1 hypothetical protein [Nitrospirota bacterium]HDZ88067.1 hypothetical protein [Nitrospirota bacterium]